MQSRAFGEKIKYFRQRAQLTQEVAAARVNIATKTFNRLERGEGNPTIETLESIAEALNCNVIDIYPGRPAPLRPVQEDLKVLIETPGLNLPLAAVYMILQSFADAPPAVRAGVLAILYDDAEIAKRFLAGRPSGSTKTR